MDQWNKIDSLEIKFYILGQFLKNVPKQLNGERLVFSTNGAVTNGYLCRNEWS